MKRRDLIKQALTAGALLVGRGVNAKTNEKYSGSKAPDAPQDPKRAFRIAHITDVHIRSDYNSVERFKKCLEEIKTKGVDFFLNGGDALDGMDYPTTFSWHVKESWGFWKDCMQSISSYEMYSCIGNHDPWTKGGADSMNGKEYVVQQLQMPGRYYSFNKKNWHFIVLDSTDSPGSTKAILDDEQRRWLEKDLNCQAPGTPILVMSHFPILSLAVDFPNESHQDADYITGLFYKHRDKKIYCINGHLHLLDESTYNGVKYFNNGAVSGNWWEGGPNAEGKTHSIQAWFKSWKKLPEKNWYRNTPSGYGILDLYEDGTLVNEYVPHNY